MKNLKNAYIFVLTCMHFERNGGVKQGILFRKLKSISLPIVLFISTYLLFEEEDGGTR